MDSDDDFQSFSPPKELSPQVHHQRLKRLKKSNPRSPKKALTEPIDEPILLSSVDFAKLEALENDSETLDFNDSKSGDDPVSSQESLSQDVGNEDDDEEEKEGNLDRRPDEELKKTKRVLEFDDDVKNGSEVGEENMNFEVEKLDKEQNAEDDFLKKKLDKKKRKKGMKRDSNDEVKAKVLGLNKRREETERKAYLKELHAESQRLLRETRDATFKPIPVVQKPISSILEKIRKRKLEISKKTRSDMGYISEVCSGPREKVVDLNLSDENAAKTLEKETVVPCMDVRSSLDASNVDENKDIVRDTSREHVHHQVPLTEELTLPFRAPVHDTQDLFDDYQSNRSAAEQHEEKQNSPPEEDFVPSLPSMNLMFDSATLDNSSSDEEDNDKENIAPHFHGISDGTTPKGDPVKRFVDDEAEEEDDSDNDIHSHENEEDEDIEDFEELNDMIATEDEERPIDNERRNELHQQWLEQQDATGTDNLMQRLKCGSKLRDPILSYEEPESDEDEEEFDEEAQEQTVPRDSIRMTTRKAKQIILQMFSDKEDVYLSDNDEDTDWRHAKQRLLIRNEEQATLVSPVEDEGSREVFGLIKKLNIVTENKKKPKQSSFFDTMLKGGNSNNSSKSSFLGRVSNHPIPSSLKQGSGTVRSFIFGRDDSSSRSSISRSEESSDTVSREVRPTRSFTAKFSNSQTKFSSQNKETGAATASRNSLIEILKQSSRQSHICNQDSTVDLTKSIFSLRVPKKPMKIEGTS